MKPMEWLCQHKVAEAAEAVAFPGQEVRKS